MAFGPSEPPTQVSKTFGSLKDWPPGKLAVNGSWFFTEWQTSP